MPTQGRPETVVRPLNSCRTGYRCELVTQPVCGELSTIARIVQHPFIRRLSAARCTAYRFTITFSAATTGSRALVDQRSLRCPLEYAHVYLRLTCHGKTECSETGACIGLVTATVEAAVRPRRYLLDYSAHVEVWIAANGTVHPRVVSPCSSDCPPLPPVTGTRAAARLDGAR